MTHRETLAEFVICVRNEGCEDLEPRKLYEVLPDAAGAAEGYLRVIDESGEDYLYPASYFMTVAWPLESVQKLQELAVT